MIDIELSIKALQAGILPAFTGDEVAKLLESCDPEDAYRLKRRFRKLWRREMKMALKDASTDVDIKRTVASFSVPSNRRKAVRRKLKNEN